VPAGIDGDIAEISVLPELTALACPLDTVATEVSLLDQVAVVV